MANSHKDKKTYNQMYFETSTLVVSWKPIALVSKFTRNHMNFGAC